MEELAKTIQQKYIDELVSKYPMHRFLILFLLMLSINSCWNYKTPLLQSFDVVKVGFIFDFKSGLIANISVLQLIICIALTTFLGRLFEWLNKKTFSFMIQRHDIVKLTVELKNKYQNLKSNDELVNYYLSKDLSSDLDKQKIKMKCLSVNIEYIMAVILSIIIGMNVNIWHEYCVGVFLIGVVVFLQFRLFLFYIRNFIPLYVAEKVLQGADVELVAP
ncbi:MULTISPECIES: hypothetical protein [unclassified Serratia (in: enterobacteria)]|uniref:hypothetical protein n=1 Tax=unclassified Serratia (in: enterobacteria) TaxID=2647522 RepID=UPI0015F3A8E5|nr:MULTISPECIES: hypothetical protein [unclassified Serratia (in: enterobacteria)]